MNSLIKDIYMNKLLPLISFMFLLALPSTAYAKTLLTKTTKQDRHVCGQTSLTSKGSGRVNAPLL